MARVKAKEVCFVGNGLRQPGDVFDYEGPFNHHLEYLGGATTQSHVSDDEPSEPKLRRGRRPRAEANVVE